VKANRFAPFTLHPVVVKPSPELAASRNLQSSATPAWPWYSCQAQPPGSLSWSYYRSARVSSKCAGVVQLIEVPALLQFQANAW